MIIKKERSEVFNGFDWLNFDYLPESNGFKFELYFKEPGDLVSQSILYFHLLFNSLFNEILVQTFRPNSEWGNFCIDTWDIERDKYDYSPENKQEPTASYLAMLRDNHIEPHYSGFCKCFDWDKFLYVTLHCVMEHTAPYSMMFYVPNKEFVFYFHHTGSLGIYYKELNEEIKGVILRADVENLEIKNANDEKIFGLVNSTK